MAKSKEELNEIKEELNILKEEVKTLNNKLAELTEEDLKRVAGGNNRFPTEAGLCPKCGALSYILMSADDTPEEAFCSSYPTGCDFHEIY